MSVVRVTGVLVVLVVLVVPRRTIVLVVAGVTLRLGAVLMVLSRVRRVVRTHVDSLAYTPRGYFSVGLANHASAATIPVNHGVSMEIAW